MFLTSPGDREITITTASQGRAMMRFSLSTEQAQGLLSPCFFRNIRVGPASRCRNFWGFKTDAVIDSIGFFYVMFLDDATCFLVSTSSILKF